VIRYIFTLSLLLVSQIALAEVRLKLSFSQDEIKQGSVQEAMLTVDMQSAQYLEIQKLKGLTPQDTIYFDKLSPLISNNKDATFEAQVSVIFLKVPDQNNLQFKLGESEVRISWNDIKVIPTQGEPTFIFEAFSIPGRRNITFWVLTLLILIVTGGLSFFIYQKIKLRQSAKQQRRLLREELLSANTYEEIVKVWQKKFHYQVVFPHTADAFRNLEKTLYQILFKPSQSEEEKKEILQAYRKFVSDIQGGFDGV
jgi:hypothetical protein